MLPMTCTIRINGESYEESNDQSVKFPLYFKEDGKRFEMEQTLKMLVSFSYHFDILLERIPSPSSHVRHVKVDIGRGPDVQTTFMELIQHHLCEPNRIRISFVWDSHKKQPDPKNHRDLVRFYKKFGKHYQWGEELDYCKADIRCPLHNNDGISTSNGLGHCTITPKLFGKPRYFLSSSNDKNKSIILKNYHPQQDR